VIPLPKPFRALVVKQARFGTCVDGVPPDRVLHAFVLVDGVTPEIHSYEPDSDGIEAIQNLLCTGDVVACVQGTRLNVEVATQASIRIGAKSYSDSILTQKR
jgi:hypothetical protein